MTNDGHAHAARDIRGQKDKEMPVLRLRRECSPSNSATTTNTSKMERPCLPLFFKFEFEFGILKFPSEWEYDALVATRHQAPSFFC